MLSLCRSVLDGPVREGWWNSGLGREQISLSKVPEEQSGGAKARRIVWGFAARLKSCPDASCLRGKQRDCSVSGEQVRRKSPGLKAQPFERVFRGLKAPAPSVSDPSTTRAMRCRSGFVLSDPNDKHKNVAKVGHRARTRAARRDPSGAKAHCFKSNHCGTTEVVSFQNLTLITDC